MDLRRELVNYAVVRGAAMHGCAVEVAGGITHHSVVSKPSVGSAFEAISNALYPTSVGIVGELENHTAITARASRTGRAIHGSGFVKNHVADGTASVGSTFETVEHSFFPRAIEPASKLVYGTKIMGAVVVRCAIETTLTVQSQSAVGKSCIGLTLERVNCCERVECMGLGSFKGNGVPVRAAWCGHAIETPFIKQESARRAARSIVPAREGMDDGQFPGSVRHRFQFVNDALSVHPTRRSHPIDGAVPANGQPASRTRSIIAAGECMNHLLGPDSAGGGQLVGHAAAALTRSTAPTDVRPVTITSSPNPHPLVRFAHVGASGKAVEHSGSRSIGGGCPLEDRARAKLTALNGCTIEVARAVDYQIRVDVLTIITPCEVVDDLGSSCRPSGASQSHHCCGNR